MAKKTNEKVDATQMTDEQLKKLHEKFRNDLREKFGKWLTVYDEEATKEDIDKAIDFIKGTELFSTVYKSSVESFKKSYQQQVAAVVAVPPHHHDDNPEDSNE